MQEAGNKIVKSILLAAALLLNFAVLPASASVRCETQYGGGQVCVKTGNLQINKQVKNEIKGGHEWLDNLGFQSSKRFATGETVEFRIQVKNVGDAKFDKVNVKDTLPGELELTEGNLNQDITDLEVGQTKEVFIKAKVKSAGNLNCNVINVAEVRSGDQYDKDSTQICLEQAGVAPQAKQLPQAGPEDWYILLGLSFLASTTGIFLLRSSYVRN